MNSRFESMSQLGGKALGLMRIYQLPGIQVPAFTAIPADASPAQAESIVRDYLKETKADAGGKVAVRSSALDEDGQQASLAGAFKTLLNVPRDPAAILVAVSDVQTHGQNKLTDVFSHLSGGVGVVVQKMVDKPDFAGVCLSQGFSPEEGSYLLLNFKRGLGDGLVGGETNGIQLRVLRGARISPQMAERYGFLPQLVKQVDLIERAFGGKPVDMEFAYADGQLHVLQARPFVTPHQATPDDHVRTRRTVGQVAAQVKALTASDMLCDMADINPRELLGQSAKPLNVSLFRFMFADQVVEQARASMGYAPLHAGLLREVAGKPYVSVRASAYSMRPAGISEPTYDKIVDIYKETLQDQPGLQDSVEFKVYLTNARQVPGFLASHAGRFSEAEKEEISCGFAAADGQMQQQVATFCRNYPGQLAGYRQRVRAARGQGLETALDVLQEGTRLFVQAARLAFYKKSYCDETYGSSATTDALTGLDTPSERLRRDLQGYLAGTSSRQQLAEEYGHLRPGQMDVFALPYRTDLDHHLNLRHLRPETPSGALSCRLPDTDRAELQTLFAARENIKHEFMKAYDLVAGELLAYADRKGLSHEQLGNLSLADVRNGTLPGVRAAANPVILPGVLTAGTDLACMKISTKQGAYFTRQKVEAPVLVINEANLSSVTPEQVRGRLLILDHADPGYDFLLLQKPAGIITRIGGPASHIAIRVNELGLPACIGCGIDPQMVPADRLYVLDCAGQKHYASTALAPSPQRTLQHAAHTP